jgi:FeS assembly SUF system protein
MTQPDPAHIEADIVDALQSIYDPEIPVNIYELGLIYDVDIEPSGDVRLTMTLTSPACPVAESLPLEVESTVAALPGVQSVKVEIVWDPPWGPEMMSEAAKLDLGLF